MWSFTVVGAWFDSFEQNVLEVIPQQRHYIFKMHCHSHIIENGCNSYQRFPAQEMTKIQHCPFLLRTNVKPALPWLKLLGVNRQVFPILAAKFENCINLETAERLP